MTLELRVDPIRCDAHGYCAELLPELIRRDEWGYPILDADTVPEELAADARRAVASCPRMALLLERLTSAGDDERAIHRPEVDRASIGVASG